MSIPFPLRQIFVPGKIIPMARGNAIEQLALIEVEEHIRHVRVMLDWLYPNASENLKRATDWHDIGKKIDLRSDYAKELEVLSDRRDKRRRVLADDFYGRTTRCSVTPDEAAKAYIQFLEAKPNGHIQARKDSYRLNPPFGFHASTVQPEDLPDEVENRDRDYLVNLIRLHHTFSPERLVEAAAEHDLEILHDLYRLIVADHFASEWATKVVNQIENVEGEGYRGEMRFAEKTVETEGEAQVVKREGNVVFGKIALRCETQQLTFNVNYYLQDFHFAGTQTCEVR